MRRFVLVTAVLFLLAAFSANAQRLQLDAIDSGNYDWTGAHSAHNENYIAGNPSNTYDESRDFFVFDLSGVTVPILGATLELYNPGDPPDGGNGYQSDDPSETFVMYEVTTDIAVLRAGGTGLTAVFDDLGAGQVFGTVEVSAADNAAMVSISLTPAAVASLNAADGEWAVGGLLSTMTGTRHEFIFGRTNSTHTRQLVLDLGGSIFDDGFEAGDLSAWSAHVP